MTKRLDTKENNSTPSQITCGDLVVVSPSLQACRHEIKTLLNDKLVKHYLDFYKNKKILGQTNYIG